MTNDDAGGHPRAGGSELLALFRLVGNLKTTKRTGWVRSNVQLPESVADHMYRMSIMALTSAPAHVDPAHATKLALVHDLAEALVGDITPYDGVSKEDKHDRELRAMRHVRDTVLKGHAVGHMLMRLWCEYEEGDSEAAKFVKQLDKLEMVLQADEYERQQDIDLSQFFDSTKDVVVDDALKQVDVALREERLQRSTHVNGQSANPSEQ